MLGSTDLYTAFILYIRIDIHIFCWVQQIQKKALIWEMLQVLIWEMTWCFLEGESAFRGVFLNKGFCRHRFSCNSFCLPWKQVTSVLQPSVEKPAPSAEKPAPWPSAEKSAPLPSAEKSVPLPSAEKPAGAAGEIALLVLLGLEMKKGCWFMVVCFPYTKSGKWISAISIAKVTRRDSNYQEMSGDIRM